jgi:formylglycine-generating enzyme required for sulfatase activity
MSQLAPFTDLAAFEALDSAQRQALGEPLAESLGKEFSALPTLVGSKGMVAVEHVPSGVQLVAVPGGSFEMGLTADDEDAIRACVDYDAAGIQSRLQDFDAQCSPVHTVEVSPFLLSIIHLTPEQLQRLTAGLLQFDVLSADDTMTFAARVPALRLPSEAELEYAGREGGAVSFVNDGGRVWAQTRQWPEASAWGLQRMWFAAWAADEWHENYHGAPPTSRVWSDRGKPGVYRGCLLYAPETEEELIYGLAACRGRLALPDDEWDVLVRAACSIAV